MNKRPLPPIWIIHRVSDDKSVRNLLEQFRETVDTADVIETYAVEDLLRDCEDSCFEDDGRKYRGHGLNREEKERILSHALLWKKLEKTGQPEILIIEANTQLSRNFSLLTGALARFPSDWELIHFYSRGWQRFFGERLQGNYRMCRYLKCFPETLTYLINQRGAGKLLRKVFPLRVPLEIFLSEGFLNENLIAYGIHPAIVTVRDLSQVPYKGPFLGNWRFHLKKRIHAVRNYFSEAN